MLYEKYHDAYGKKHIVPFSGIHDGYFYNLGIIQRNLNSESLLLPETDDSGKVIDNGSRSNKYDVICENY